MLDLKRVLSTMEVEASAKELVFGALFNDSAMVFYLHDRNGYGLGCNETELKILNLFLFGELIGKHIIDGTHPCAWHNSKRVMRHRAEIIAIAIEYGFLVGIRPIGTLLNFSTKAMS